MEISYESIRFIVAWSIFEQSFHRIAPGTKAQVQASHSNRSIK
uniref:Uncharacterized protein n=1 Tax=Romanomermis culicivorax TaxID=13658 RepID=A0A915KWW0_ROMCU